MESRYDLAELAQARRFLRTELADGPVSASRLRSLAQAYDTGDTRHTQVEIEWWAVEHAMRELGVISTPNQWGGVETYALPS